MKVPDIKVAPPGPKAKAIIEKDQRFTAPAYGRVYPLVVKEGRGVVIEDVDGNRFLDFMAGIAVASTGHSHPKVVKAIEEQARKFLHICGSDFYYEPMAELAEKLSRIAPGTALNRKRRRTQRQGGEVIHRRRPSDARVLSACGGVTPRRHFFAIFNSCSASTVQ